MAQQLTDDMFGDGDMLGAGGANTGASAGQAPEIPRLGVLAYAANEPVELPADRSPALLKAAALVAVLALVAAVLLRRRR